MKSYGELKIEMGAIQHQMVEANNIERAHVLREGTVLCRKIGFTAGILKGELEKCRGDE